MSSSVQKQINKQTTSDLRSPCSPPSVHTIVSFLFPKEYSDLLSFLVLSGVGRGTGGVVGGVGGADGQDVAADGELGADWEVA